MTECTQEGQTEHTSVQESLFVHISIVHYKNTNTQLPLVKPARYLPVFMKEASNLTCHHSLLNCHSAGSDLSDHFGICLLQSTESGFSNDMDFKVSPASTSESVT